MPAGFIGHLNGPAVPITFSRIIQEIACLKLGL